MTERSRISNMRPTIRSISYPSKLSCCLIFETVGRLPELASSNARSITVVCGRALSTGRTRTTLKSAHDPEPKFRFGAPLVNDMRTSARPLVRHQPRPRLVAELQRHPKQLDLFSTKCL